MHSFDNLENLVIFKEESSMPYSKERCKPPVYLLAPFILTLVVLCGVAAAKEEKTYPESGKIVGIG